jgi:hypothetical protein
MPRLSAITVLGVAVGTILAGCSPSQPPPAVATAPPRPVPIDGTYGGVMQLSRGDAMNCGNENPITLQVQNHTFTYRLAQPRAEWKPVIVFTAAIAPDGSFNAQSGPDSMSGQVAGGSMQGEIVGDICGFSFNADRGGTW